MTVSEIDPRLSKHFDLTQAEGTMLTEQAAELEMDLGTFISAINAGRYPLVLDTWLGIRQRMDYIHTVLGSKAEQAVRKAHLEMHQNGGEG